MGIGFEFKYDDGNFKMYPCALQKSSWWKTSVIKLRCQKLRCREVDAKGGKLCQAKIGVSCIQPRLLEDFHDINDPITLQEITNLENWKVVEIKDAQHCSHVYRTGKE